MEAVGAGASALTFVTVALSSVKLLYETLSSVKDGPSNVKKAADVIMQLRRLLEQIQQSTSIVVDGVLLNDLESCISDLTTFADKVVKLQTLPQESRGGRLWKRLKAFANEKDLDQISTSVSQHCARLTLRLSVGTREAVSQLQGDVAQSTNAIRSLEKASQNHITAESAQYNDLQNIIDSQQTHQLSFIRDSQLAIRTVQENMAVHMNTNSSHLVEATSSIHSIKQDLTARLDSHESVMKDKISAVQETLKGLQPSTISNSQASVMQDKLSQILQHLQTNTTSSSPEQPRVFEEDDINPEYSSTSKLGAETSPINHQDPDRRLIESIEQLGKLVAEKEQVFDNFAEVSEDCEGILDTLSSVLHEARMRAGDALEQLCPKHQSDAVEINRSLKHFDKQFALSHFTLNPQNQSFQLGRKRASTSLESNSSFHELNLGVGTLSVKRRKLVRICQCNDETCYFCGQEHSRAIDHKGARKEVTTTVMFVPKDIRKHRMFVASNFASQLARGNISSISYLAINRIFPETSKVFHVVREGQLDELRQMLQTGEATLRDYDEGGGSLLFHATYQPNVCKFLLDNGLEVDHVGKVYGYYSTAIGASYTEGSSMDEVCRLDQCIEMLLEAGADPFLILDPDDPESIPWICRNEENALSLNVTKYVHKSISNGLVSMSDVLNYRHRDGQSMLHVACSNFGDGSKENHILQLLQLGFDLNDVVSVTGWTCLHFMINSLIGPYDHSPELVILREQRLIIFLFRNGADPRAVARSGISVSDLAYPNPPIAPWRDRGSYPGDLWDSCLVAQGYSITEFRAGRRRKAKYINGYTRNHFEMLWLGRESLCPYWIDEYTDASYDGDDES